MDPIGFEDEVVAANSGFGALNCKQDPNAGAEPLERKMVCGGADSLGAVRGSLGLMIDMLILQARPKHL